jgi:hypothetical protein
MSLIKPKSFQRTFLSEVLAKGKTLADIDITKTYSVYDDENYKLPITKIKEGYFNKESQSYLYEMHYGERRVSSYAPRWIVTELKQDGKNSD